MSTMIQTEVELDADLVSDLREIELGVLTQTVTLADVMREGVAILPKQAVGWGEGDAGCALSAAFAGARARNLV